VNEAEIACCCFVVSCCEAPGAFEFVETTLNLVAQGIDKPINRNDLLSIGSGRNDSCATALFDSGSNVIGVIALIGNEDFGIWQVIINKGIIAFVVRHFATGNLCPDGQPHGIGYQMNLGRKTTF
jgi:hypothetical protein